MDLICGINPVIEALTGGSRHFDRLLVVKGLRNRRIAEAIRQASGLGVPLRFEARETLDRVAGGVPHQGIIAVVSVKPVLGLDELLSGLGDPALLMVLDGVEDPRNLGAVLRTCEAVAADGVVLPQRRSAGLSETVSRASAGALEHVRIARVGNVVQALETLKQRGLWIVGLDAGGRQRWDQVDLKRPIAFVLGGEGRGMRRLVRERCDHLVGLPLFGHVESLNVSVAAGVALYEAVRQRGSVPSQVKPIPPASGASAPVIVGPQPGDAEDDPGRQGPGVHDAVVVDAEAGETRVELLRLHGEEAAWSGPVVVRPRVQRSKSNQGSRPPRRGRPRKAAAPARPKAEGGRAPADAQAPERSRRRRTRRRSRRGPRRPAGAAGGGPPSDGGAEE